jgi:hypothetical protein
MSRGEPFGEMMSESHDGETAKPYFEVDGVPSVDSFEESGCAGAKSKNGHLGIWASPLILLIGIIGVYFGIRYSFTPPGSIRVNATEGSIVEVIDKTGAITCSTVGTGMFEDLEDVPVGGYTISVKKEGYQAVRLKADVASNRVFEKVIHLAPLPPGLMITSIPSEVLVYDGYEYLGTTPLRLDPLENRALSLRLIKAGYQLMEKRIDWVPGSRIDFDARMQEAKGPRLFVQLIAAPNLDDAAFFNLSLNGKGVDYVIHRMTGYPTHTLLDIWVDDLENCEYELGFAASNWASSSQMVNPDRTSVDTPVIIQRKNAELRIQVSGLQEASIPLDLAVLLNGCPIVFTALPRGVDGEFDLILAEVHFGTGEIQVITREYEPITFKVDSDEQLSGTRFVQLKKKLRYADLNTDFLEGLPLGELMIYVDAGNPAAENQLGWRYFTGKDVPQSNEEALRWFSKSAGENTTQALISLAQMYENGHGVDQDCERAFHLYLAAAEKGDRTAQSCIASMYYYGRGVARSLTESAKWFRESGNQGELTSQINLGFMYENGYGVLKDISEAKFWYQKAAEQGDKNARDSLIRLRQFYN